MVRLDPGRQIGVEGMAPQAGGVAVDPTPTGRGDSGQHLRVAADDPRVVHDLGHPNGTVVVDQPLDVGGVELGARRLELRCRHTR